jgi:branched-chain amino acid aminotransferase
MLAKQEAQKAGYDDALMLGYDGRVAETSSANIFIVLDGKLVTPTPDCFLDGITKRQLEDIAKECGIEIVERKVSLEETRRASEVLVAGTAVEVRPVTQIGESSYSVGEVTRTLIEKFHERARGVTADTGIVRKTSN